MRAPACRHGEDVPCLQAHSQNEEMTRALGAALGAFLVAGDVVALDGELGAGKTRFVQGLAQALGVSVPVVSPTFVVVREYAGRLRLYHVDAYRLSGSSELEDLGWEEVVEGGGIVVVEWASRIHAALPRSYVSVRLSVQLPVNEDVAGPDDRDVEFHSHGEGWSARWPLLQTALAPYGTPELLGAGNASTEGPTPEGPGAENSGRRGHD